MDDFRGRINDLGLVISEDDRKLVEKRLKELKKLRDTAAKAIENRKQAAKARSDEEMPKVTKKSGRKKTSRKKEDAEGTAWDAEGKEAPGRPGPDD